MKNGSTWAAIEKDIYRGMTVIFGPSFILIAVGIMIASSWIAGGVVPTMIYYGLTLLNPTIFYAAVCLVCAIVSLSIGSSWTTAASVGVAMIGTANGQLVTCRLCRGVISGLFWGQDVSHVGHY